MKNIAEDDYANKCSQADTQLHTYQTQSHCRLCTGRASPDPIKEHLHTHTHKHTRQHTPKHKHIYLDWVPNWKGNSPFISLRCFLPVNTQNKSALASEPTPITIMKHICHKNFVQHELYQFSKNLFLFMGQGKCSGADILLWKKFSKSWKFSAPTGEFQFGSLSYLCSV